jgi:hypothetical protein
LLRISFLTLAIVAAASPVFSQIAPGPAWRFSVGYEAHLDRLRYTFENASSFSTGFLVPHSFAQSYAARSSWIVGAIRYSIRHDRFATELGFAPARRTAGSDFDTFYNPGNDVIVYGTDGDVRLRSFRVAQWSEATVFGLPWRLGYRFRRDRSQFLPTDRIVTHSTPPSEERSPTFGREITISEVHAIPIDVTRQGRLGSPWQVRVSATVSPLVWGRLTTILPDKYDRHIVFSAKAAGYGGSIEMRRALAGWMLNLGARYERTQSYSAARQIALQEFLISAVVER